MDDNSEIQAPEPYQAILARSRAVQFQMNSDLRTGSLLRTLAGMDARSSLVSVENDPVVLAIARDEIGADPRLRLMEADGGDFLASCRERCDFVYADTWPGKYSHLRLSLILVKPGGIFLVDDRLPQPNWPAGHDAKGAELSAELEGLPDLSRNSPGPRDASCA